MYIQSLKLAYFKGFSNNETRLDFSIPNGELGSGLNILIGENNSGKSTVFEAISFLRDETKEVNRLKNKQADNTQPNEASVELTFYGEIENVISQFSPANKKEAFLGSIYDNKLTARRCTENYKEITLWDESRVGSEILQAFLHLLKNYLKIISFGLIPIQVMRLALAQAPCAAHY